MVKVLRTSDELRFEWPLAPRMLYYVPYLIILGLWIPAAFALAAELQLSPGVAFGIALAPPVLLLAWLAPRLAAELSRPAVVLTPGQGGIGVGRAGIFEPSQFSVTHAPSGRRRARSTVALTVRATVGSTSVELELLREHLSEDDAQGLVRHIRDFLDAA